MNVRNAGLAVFVFVLICLPGRADVVLTYRLGLPPSGNMPNPSWIDNEADPANGTNQPIPVGMPIVGPLVIPEGETRYLQVCISANATPLTSPTPSFPQNAWNNSNRMIFFGLVLYYPAGIVDQPFSAPQPPVFADNRANANAIVPYSAEYPNTFTGYNMGATMMYGTTTTSGVGASPGGIVAERVIAVFKLEGLATGSGTITLGSGQTGSPTSHGFGLAGVQNLDEYIFHPSHNWYPLAIQVTPAPEPSSLALAGLTLMSFGWTKLRKT